MMERVEDRNVARILPLLSPRAMKEELPLPPRAAALVTDARRAIGGVLHGRDRTRLVVVAGPCSIHDPDAALEYAGRLHSLREALNGELVVVMRTYFEKPRTSVGWKGLLTDPHLDGSRDVATGIRQARSLLLRILEIGVPCATEFLDPITPQYLADLVSWAVIGARTSESQVHRALASGLSMPVGFKNATDGSLETAVNGMTAAREPHAFLGIDAEGRSAVIETRGNPDRHLVLRGGRDRPNYGPEDVARAHRLAAREGVPRPVMVDCSHDNSGKEHTRQGLVWRAVLSQVRAGESAIFGLLLESNLEAGRQELRDGVAPRPGVSVTDACVGFEETEALLREAAAAVRAVRPRGIAGPVAAA